MRTVLAQSCSLLDGCFNRTQHRAFAWGFVILFVGMVLTALVLAILAILILNGISIGLAAAAALELAYTLFTPGPDEALDPLMLALSATLLLKLTKLASPVSMGEALGLLLLGLLLAALFATRLMLAERDEEDKHPKIWWVPDRERKQGKKS